MSRPAFVQQPGPAPAERIVAVEGRGRAFPLRLQAGQRLLDAVAQGFAEQGFTGGTVNFGRLALSPFAYVMPALSKTGENAAFYSDVHRPAGTTYTEHGAMTVGRRDGAPFFHCHAIWREADGSRSGGHMLPDATFMAETATVKAFGFAGGHFRADPDPETRFTLFGPVADGAPAATGSRAFALRLRPNQDVSRALETFCATHGIRNARVRGGVGSTIGAQFQDGTLIENFATEVFLMAAAVESGTARLGSGLVDYTGALAQGTLVRGDNPVLMTFELVLDVKD